jgi:hypothetical protein
MDAVFKNIYKYVKIAVPSTSQNLRGNFYLQPCDPDKPISMAGARQVQAGVNGGGALSVSKLLIRRYCIFSFNSLV